MKAVIYLYQCAFKNRLKKAVRKPQTYIYMVLLIAYLLLLVKGFQTILSDASINTPEGLVALLTMGIFFIKPANINSYVKRKGLIFKKSDMNFVFVSPVSAKRILLYAYIKSFLITVGFGLLLTLGIIVFFPVEPWKIVLYGIFACFLENILEGAFVVLLYGNERFPEKIIKFCALAFYLIMAAFFVIGFVYMSQYGVSKGSAIEYMFLPAIQMVPVIGWSIGVIHLIIMGPSVVSIISSVLWGLMFVLLVTMAYKMPCTGQYYEDAHKFADDYAEVIKRSRKGEIVRMGKKPKFNRANIQYKGKHARAIFYRQLLEYKKSRFFIFGLNTIISVIVSIMIIYILHVSNAEMEADFARMRSFLIPGIMAYVTFLTSGYVTKWDKELANPYTYLIPDTSFRKLWYATLMEHIRALVDGCLIAVPIGIYTKLSFLQIVLAVCIYIGLQAMKLYLAVFAEGVLGNILGEGGKKIMRMVLFGLLIGFVVLAAFAGTIWMGMTAGYICMIIILFFFTLGCMAAAAGIFDKMEAVS